MIPRNDPAVPGEKELVRIFRSLDAENRRALCAFAEFLAARRGEEPADSADAHPVEPRAVPRPERETVVAAIKRLSHTYSMLDRGAMLNETSTLVSAHVLGGRPASDVIDELEALFARSYNQYRRKHEQ